jgi:amidohydrolase
MNLEKIINLRHQLHANPNLSNDEASTVEIISEYIKDYNPTRVIENVGGVGKIFYFEKDPQLKTVALRADLDALPIIEENDLAYKSQNHGVSHKCGHDGHMSMVCGVLEYLDKIPCNLILLFQPAEETGEGAKRMVEDEKIKDIKIDYIFGLHNLPGVPAGQIHSSPSTFACSSVGMEIKIQGQSAHAAEPNMACTPYPLVAALLTYIKENNHNELDDHFKIITMTHLRIGEESFGITPGDGVIFLTLRSIKDEYINKFKKDLEQICESFKDLRCDISYHDYFPALINSKEAFSILDKAGAKFDFVKMDRPFKWSEDFGYFTQNFKGAYFGIGSGVDCHNLHHKNYDFNDNIIRTGVEFYFSVLNSLL